MAAIMEGEPDAVISTVRIFMPNEVSTTEENIPLGITLGEWKNQLLVHYCTHIASHVYHFYHMVWMEASGQEHLLDQSDMTDSLRERSTGSRECIHIRQSPHIHGPMPSAQGLSSMGLSQR